MTTTKKMKPINLKMGNERVSELETGRESTLGKQVKDALAAVNRKATAHAFCDLYEINGIVQAAEKQLDDLGLSKAERPGAIMQAASGFAVPNAYKYKRNGTQVTLERKSSGWMLTNIQSVEIYKEGGKQNLVLTPDQDLKDVANFRKAYKVKS